MTTKPFFAGVIGATLLLAASAHADSASLIQELQVKIQSLEAKLSEMRAKPQVTDTGTVQGQGMRIVGVGFSETLGRGSRGNAVSRLQQFLKDKSDVWPDGLVTGYFGASTEAAIQRFQIKFGIDPVGVVGPKTRAKLNEILLAPPPPPAGGPPPPISGPIPTPGELGQPSVSYFQWGSDYLAATIVHDPGAFTVSYAVYLRQPGSSASTRFGPYPLTALGIKTTDTNNAAFTQIGTSVWEWKLPIDFLTVKDGGYSVTVRAVGNGGVESQTSPALSVLLYAQAQFNDLLQGTNLEAVASSTITKFPIRLRLTNQVSDLYYRYSLLDATSTILTSSIIAGNANASVQSDLYNYNGYVFTPGRTYRIRVDSYDNVNANASVRKQKSNELTFTWASPRQ